MYHDFNLTNTIWRKKNKRSMLYDREIKVEVIFITYTKYL